MYSQSQTQVAFVGIGQMGMGMCYNLVHRLLWSENHLHKNTLVVFNRTRCRAENLQLRLPTGSVRIAASVEDAVVSSDIIFTCLSDDDAVKEVFELALSSIPSGKLFVECSTIHPQETRKLSERVLQAGARFVACPVFGAPDRASSGQLVCVPAGPSSDVKAVLPYCKDVMGRAVINLGGKQPEAATTLKVIGNSMIFNMVESVAEGHVLAEKSGLGGEHLHQYLTLFFPGVYTDYSTRMMTGDYWDREEPLFHAYLARKDIRHAVSLAQAHGTRLPALEIADANLAKVEDLKQNKGDYVGLYGILRQEAGMSYENN